MRGNIVWLRWSILISFMAGHVMGVLGRFITPDNFLQSLIYGLVMGACTGGYLGFIIFATCKEDN